MTVSLTLDKEIEADIRRRWATITAPDNLSLTPEQVISDVHFLTFQLDRFQKAQATFEEREAAVCPEDVGFEEYIRALEKKTLIQWQPISTAPKDGTFILLLGDSGYTTTPYRVAVGRWVEEYRDFWITYSNDAFTDSGEPPTHWAPWNPPDLDN